MLHLLPESLRDCERVTRRGLLQIGSISALGLSLPQLLAARKANASAGNASKDVSCILIWTQGGTSHHDTFDPKPNAPQSVRGEFGFISTAIPGVQFTDVVPNMARELNRFALLRSWNPQNGSHGIADQYVMSGRRFNGAVPYPTFGSVVSWNKGFQSALPPFMQLGSSIDRRFGGGSSGILGSEHNAFEITADPNAANFTVRDISLPGGVDSDRLSRRHKMLAAVDQLQRQTDRQPAAFAALDEHYQAAINMITAPETKRAFKIEEETKELRDRYGRNRFGQSCLIARRLVENGVRFVTITDGGWDTHANNFKSLKNSRLPPIDQAIPTLLADLEDHGLLDTTLVVWLTDFGRTPNINSASGRDHWASAGFAIMAGAGVPGGAVLGATDEEGARPIQNEYSSEDIGVTIYEKLGLSPELIANTADGRPIRLIEGHPIKEWM